MSISTYGSEERRFHAPLARRTGRRGQEAAGVPPKTRWGRVMAPLRFVADCMLGRLARWLRAFGFDVTYHPFADDDEVAQWARERDAVLLTRDTRLRAPGTRMFFVRDDHVEEQLRQVVDELPLDLSQARPLTRCTVCNQALAAATRDEVWDRIPPFVYLTQVHFAVCPGCGRVYWEGTHAPRMRARLRELMGRAAGGPR